MATAGALERSKGLVNGRRYITLKGVENNSISREWYRSKVNTKGTIWVRGLFTTGG